MNPEEVRQIGPYTVRRFIAEGGMAWVFEVVDPKFEVRRLALKMLKPEAAVGEEFERFRDEANLLAALNHPNLVTIFDLGRDEASGCFYYTMEFIDGPSLADKLREEGPLELDEARRIFGNLLDALGELHRREIVHRDIKPANVLIGREDRRPRLADLGIARQQRGTGRTKTGVAIGTVAYMSPEQMRGRPVDARSDIFSTGVMLYEALTGVPLYDGVEGVDSTSDLELIGYLFSRSTSGEEIPIAYPAEPVIPAPVRAVIEKACSVFPEDRYANAAEMRQALEGALRPKPGVRVEGTPWPAWMAATALLLVVALVAAGWWYWIGRREERAARASLERVRALNQSVPALLEGVKDLEPAPPRNLLASADGELARAQDYLLDCEEEFELEQFAIAGEMCGRSDDRFLELCKVTAAHVGERAEEQVQAAGEAVEPLRQPVSQLPAEQIPEEWEPLVTGLAALEEAPKQAPPCALLEAELGRIATATTSVAAATAVKGKLEELWPQLAERARNEARTAEKLAESDVDAEEYRAARDAGRKALAAGERLAAKGDPFAAREAYREALAKFRIAQEIMPAAQARAEVRAFETEMPAGVSPAARWRIADADELFSREAWAEAAQAYREGLDRAKQDLDVEVRKQDALNARASARAARESAAAEGAGASGIFERAEQSLADAETAVEGKQYGRAEELFQAAQQGFDDARRAAIQALDAARDRGIGARHQLEQLVGRGSCDRLESQTARDACGEGVTDLARGEEALARGDAATAVLGFQTAAGAFESASAAEDAFQAVKPRPPEIVGRTPTRDTVEIDRNRSVSVSVEATDPNGDALRYSWSFAGHPLEAAGGTLEFRPEGSGQLSVRVDDGRGGSVSTAWKIVVKKPPPPPAEPRRPPAAVASKPRPTPQPSPAVASKPKPAPEPSPVVASKSKPRPSAPAPDEIAGTLDRYESCLNARDMRCLERVWMLSPNSVYRDRWQKKFASPDPLKVSVSIRSIERRGDEATVIYDQREQSSRGERTWPYRAELIKRVGGWQMRENRLYRP